MKTLHKFWILFIATIIFIVVQTSIFWHQQNITSAIISLEEKRQAVDAFTKDFCEVPLNLSRYARIFCETQNEKFYDDFFNLYDKFSEDFPSVEKNDADSIPKFNSQTVGMIDFCKRQNFTQEESEKLEEALELIHKLAVIELQAISCVKNGEFVPGPLPIANDESFDKFIMRILYDNQYEDSLQKIHTLCQSFLADYHTKTDRKRSLLRENRSQLGYGFLLSQFAAFLAIIGVAVQTVWMVRKEATNKSRQTQKEHEAFVSDIFTSIQDGIFVIDKNYNILRTNPTFDAMYKEHHPLIGKKCWKTSCVDKICDDCPAEKMFRTGMLESSIHKDVPPNDQNEIWLEHFSYPIFDERGEIIAGINFIRDITKRKEMEDELQQYHRILEALVEKRTNELGVMNKWNQLMLEGIPLTCVLINEHLEMFDCNQFAVDFLGLSSKHELFEKAFDMFPEVQPDGSCSQELVRNAIKTAFESGYNQVEWYFQAKNGEQIPVEVTLVRLEHGEGQVLAVYTRDLRKEKAIEAGKAKRERLMAALNHTARLLLAYDSIKTFDEVIQEVFDHLGRAAGVDRVYIWQNHLDEQDRLCCTQIHEWAIDVQPQQGKKFTISLAYDDVIPNWQETLPAGNCINALVRDLPPEEQAILLPQGIVSILIAPIMLGDNFWGFIGFDDCKYERIWSGTEIGILSATGNVIASTIARQQLEQSLYDARILAEKSAQAKSEFLANMSHEIRTPMNAILGLTYLCLQTNLDEQQREYLDKSQSATNNLLRIIDDILDFSKIEAGKLALEDVPFKLSETIREVMDVIAHKVDQKGISLYTEIDESVPDELIGDPLRLRQVLINLANNAVKFTENGGVTISVKHELKKEASNDIFLKFSVNDTGIGMTPEHMEKLFSSFTQADSSTTRKYGGTGLGLVISKNLIELMGGKIGVTSKLGEGTSFSFTICFHSHMHGVPTRRATTQSLIEARMSEPGDYSNQNLTDVPNDTGQIHGARILLAEDNKINQMVADGMLKMYGVILTIANDGVEALELVKNNDYDIVLMDIQMPNMDGLETTKAIRGLNKPGCDKLPIIAMTAHAMDSDYQKSLEVGMNDHLTKPIDPEVLRKTLLKWCRQSVN
ncbi:MAG: ATP-binding protein [Thermoguttaceae bacterium]